ncbi:hypothetical protein BLJAPNOD_05595 [Ensifer sp. M14]|uniref:hemagglutinin repeat-containing protein n=1 Tax=Ensifer sp. M14 TaxID=2203782 RepID=UPI000E1C5D58|nr:hemagglutinin repeat-containing protein [Ensifer sp. M14]RDL47499.1 hypothetical protein BLJAPNOD_05595 [Ensifer sp. M14]
MKTREKRQQEGQIVYGVSKTIGSGNDILISGSAIRSGADVTLKAADEINITAAREEVATTFGSNRGTSEQHSGSAIAAGGSIAVTAGSDKGDHDLNIVGSRLQAKERVDLKAADDLTIAEPATIPPWIFPGSGAVRNHPAAVKRKRRLAIRFPAARALPPVRMAIRWSRPRTSEPAPRTGRLTST